VRQALTPKRTQTGNNTSLYLLEATPVLTNTSVSLDIRNSSKPKYIKRKKLSVKLFFAELAYKNPDPGHRIRLSDLVDILTGPDFGFSLLKAMELLRWLVEKEKLLIPVEDDGLVSFLLRRNLSEFEERQQRLQDAWLAADEATTRTVLKEETKELEASTKLLLLEEDEKDGRSVWRKEQKKKQNES
jgi:hypothetical protein